MEALNQISVTGRLNLGKETFSGVIADQKTTARILEALDIHKITNTSKGDSDHGKSKKQSLKVINHRKNGEAFSTDNRLDYAATKAFIEAIGLSTFVSGSPATEERRC